MNRKKIEAFQKNRKRRYLSDICSPNEQDEDSGAERTEQNDVPTYDGTEQSTSNEAVASSVTFERGKTQQGGMCLWLHGFRYTQNKGNRWRCSNRSCTAFASIINNDEEAVIGTLGTKEHNHLPEQQKQQGELKRQKIKESVRAEPRLKPTRILAQMRRSATDEVYMAMSSDDALKSMMRREKKKQLGNIDVQDPLAFIIPVTLREKRGEDIVLYDSRTVRKGEKDVVLVFGSEKTLDILRHNRGTWHIDVHPWEEDIFRRALFPIPLWNMHVQAASALARTNNGLEATHLHFMKGLCHHPALSDFICEVKESIDRQVDAARSAQKFAHKRHKRYIIQDALIMRILADASYNCDAEIQELMTALGLQVQGYAGKLKELENFDDSLIHVP